MIFSIIIIGYNQKNVICDAIRSALDQSYQDLEVIYVDDASTDGSIEYIKSSFSDKRLRIIQAEENRGSVVSRLLGIKAARGDWCLLVDGDDTLCMNACKVLSETIYQQDDGIDIIGFGANIVCTHVVPKSEKEWMEHIAGEPLLGICTSEELLQIQYRKREKSWNLWNKCFKIDVLRKTESAAVYETLYRLTDYYLCFLACNEATHYFGINERLYNYNYGSGITLQSLDLDGLKRYMSSHKTTALLKDYAEKKGTLELYKSCFNDVERETILLSGERILKTAEKDQVSASQDFIDEFGPQGLLTVFTEISDIRAETVRQREEIDRLQHDIEHLQHVIESICCSSSFRFGRFITWLPRKLRDLLCR